MSPTWTPQQARDAGFDPDTGQPLRPAAPREPVPTSAETQGIREITGLHDPFRTWLDAKRIVYVYSRPDKPTGQRVGLPDFLMVVNRHPLGIEFKRPGGRTNQKQRELHDRMCAHPNGWDIHVCYDLQTACQLVLEAMQLPKTQKEPS